MEEQDIVKVIEDNYKICIEGIEKNNESTDGNVYIIETKSKKYVLKIYKSESHTKNMIEIHQLLADRKINAPQIIKSIDNNEYEVFDDCYFVVYSFVDGKKLKEYELDNNKIKQIAKYLKKLHNVKIPVDYELETVNISNNDNQSSILHFDITKNNIFVNNEEIYFIDFDDAKYGPAIFDVAIAVTNLFISKVRGADIHGINLFIEEYYNNDAEKIKQEIPRIKEAALIWLNETLVKQHLSTSIKDGLNNKVNWINKIWS